MALLPTLGLIGLKLVSWEQLEMTMLSAFPLLLLILVSRGARGGRGLAKTFCIGPLRLLRQALMETSNRRQQRELLVWGTLATPHSISYALN